MDEFETLRNSVACQQTIDIPPRSSPANSRPHGLAVPEMSPRPRKAEADSDTIKIPVLGEVRGVRALANFGLPALVVIFLLGITGVAAFRWGDPAVAGAIDNGRRRTEAEIEERKALAAAVKAALDQADRRSEQLATVLERQTLLLDRLREESAASRQAIESLTQEIQSLRGVRE